MISSNNLSALKDSVNVIVNNKDKIKNLNIDFSKYIDTNSIPE
jgi:hypothetical protein